MTGWGLGVVGSKYWEILMTSFMVDPLAGYGVSYVVVAIPLPKFSAKTIVQ